MALDRKYLEEELSPALRREMQMSVNMPLLSPDQLPTGTSYRQASPSVQLPIYPTSMPYVTPELSTPNMTVNQDGVQYGAGSYEPPERVGLLSSIPGRPGTKITALPYSSELMSNTPRAAANTGLNAGEAIAQDRNQGNLISGLLGDINWKGILDQLIKTFQRPEMLTPGVNALTAFGMSGAALNQAEIAGAKEQAQLDQANQQQALENEYRRIRDARDAARFALDKEKARADRLKAPVITKAKIEAFTALAGTDKVTRDIINDLYNTAFGRFIGYETLGGGQGASKEDTQAAVAAEAISIQNANPRMSPVEAVREAAKRLQAKASAAPSETKKDRFPPKNQ
jgi:hypothetical protein